MSTTETHLPPFGRLSGALYGLFAAQYFTMEEVGLFPPDGSEVYRFEALDSAGERLSNQAFEAMFVKKGSGEEGDRLIQEVASELGRRAQRVKDARGIVEAEVFVLAAMTLAVDEARAISRSEEWKLDDGLLDEVQNALAVDLKRSYGVELRAEVEGRVRAAAEEARAFVGWWRHLATEGAGGQERP